MMCQAGQKRCNLELPCMHFACIFGRKFSLFPIEEPPVLAAAEEGYLVILFENRHGVLSGDGGARLVSGLVGRS
jgi:hypothetical protein